ncbi:MAG: P27 family phage terminase small subunit [Acidobacteriales bacterium]|nr:P27 family phage terminase small subunit [Terriglobales bacterium]
MPRGRPRKPLPELILDGTFRHDRHGEAEEVWLPHGTPAKPKWLEGEAGELWDLLIPAFQRRGVTAEVDAAELSALCEWWGRYRELSKQLAALDGVIGESYEIAFRLANTAWKNFSTAAAKFGLNPSDRSRLRLEANDKLANDLIDFAKGRGRGTVPEETRDG